jgi:membrane associated rhomboid family serine protease
MINKGGTIGQWYQRLRYQWRSGGPVITGAIVVICVVMWLIEIACKYAAPMKFMLLVYNGAFMPALAFSKPWTWLTSMFLHDPNVFHVLFNMLTLIAIGPYLEKLLDHWNFLAFYLICGLGGAEGLLVYSAITHDWGISAYGASDALFGLFAALLMVFRTTKTDIRGMLVCLAINFAMPLFMPEVAWQSHLGGFIVGLVLTWLLLRGTRALRYRPLWLRMLVYGAIVVVVLVVLAVLLMLAQMPYN